VTIAITGGTGFVGQTFIELALERGLELRALARLPQEPRDNIDWIRGDLANKRALRELCAGAEAVIHIAGVVNAPDADIFEEANVQGTMSVVEAAVAARVPRFIFVSSLAARQPNLSSYGASKARAEKIVAASGLDWTIVRPPAVYGPRDREMFELFRAAKWGVVPLPPPGRLSLIHVADLSNLLLALLPSNEDVTRQLFEPDDGRKDGWNNRELAREIGVAVGRKPWSPHLSRNTLLHAAKVDGWVRRRRAKLTSDRVNYMSHPDWVVSKRKAVPPVLWTPKVETRDGLAATAAWYRLRGWL
jgi:nucleoside-diphosphate-sugar epimerase